VSVRVIFSNVTKETQLATHNICDTGFVLGASCISSANYLFKSDACCVQPSTQAGLCDVSMETICLFSCLYFHHGFYKLLVVVVVIIIIIIIIIILFLCYLFT
jgi:hypothetical protein